MIDKAEPVATYVQYQERLGPPWLRRHDGAAWERAFGAVKDYFVWLAAAAVRIHAIAYADEDALVLLGLERRFRHYPDEYIEAYRARVQGAWTFWPMGGTRPGMLWAFQVAGYRAELWEWGLPPPLGSNDRVNWSEFSIDLYPTRPGLISRDWGQADAVWGPPIEMPVARALPAPRATPNTWDAKDLRWDELGWTWDAGAPPSQAVIPQVGGGLWGTTIRPSENERIMGIIRQMKSGHSKLRQLRYINRMVAWGPSFNYLEHNWSESRLLTIYPPAVAAATEGGVTDAA